MQRGKRQIADEASLLSAIERIEQQYRVQGLFHLDYQSEAEERQVRRYRGQPAHIERQARSPSGWSPSGARAWN